MSEHERMNTHADQESAQLESSGPVAKAPPFQLMASPIDPSGGGGGDKGKGNEPYTDQLTAGEKLGKGPVKLKEGYEGALFYSQIGEQVFVIPASRVPVDDEKKTVGFDTLVHSFQDVGASVTTVYITYPDDDAFGPLQWYNQASMGGMIDIWGALLDEFANLIDQMKPKDWSPGEQPPNFYVGNEAHKAIGRNYRGFHTGELIFLNNFPISSILDSYKDQGIDVKPENLTPKELSDKPDITNVSSDHLFEIKPWTQAGEGTAQMTYYQQIFLKAGVPVRPGPMSDPGVKGAMPVPGGYIVFYSPTPGVILYKKKNKSPEEEPHRVPKGYPSPVMDPKMVPDEIPRAPINVPLLNPFPRYEPETKGPFDWAYWEELTGLTGAALVIYLIVSEGTRLFPPRNLIPVP